MISEEELVSAIFSAQDVLGSVTGFTVIVDDRKLPASLAFLVEIDGQLCETVFFLAVTGIHFDFCEASSAHQAPARIEATLRRSNQNVPKMLDNGELAPPTVHVLKPGTFREYRALKIKAAITGTGQIKVPVVPLGSRGTGTDVAVRREGDCVSGLGVATSAT